LEVQLLEQHCALPSRGGAPALQTQAAAHSHRSGESVKISCEPFVEERAARA
jgi:hypothetical protein